MTWSQLVPNMMDPRPAEKAEEYSLEPDLDDAVTICLSMMALRLATRGEECQLELDLDDVVPSMMASRPASHGDECALGPTVPPAVSEAKVLPSGVLMVSPAESLCVGGVYLGPSFYNGVFCRPLLRLYIYNSKRRPMTPRWVTHLGRKLRARSLKGERGMAAVPAA